MYKSELKIEAVELRKQGYSYSYIREKLHISKSTLSAWLSRVPYRANKETLARMRNGRASSALAKRKSKLASFEGAYNQALKDLGDIDQRDLFMLGIGLYIGEGTKLDGITRVINANPRVLKLAIEWFEACFGLKRNAFRVRIHLYPDNDIEAALEYWSSVLRIPRSQFYPVTVDMRVGKKMAKRGKLPHGTAHLSVKSLGNKEHGVFLSRKIRAYMEEVLPKVGTADS